MKHSKLFPDCPVKRKKAEEEISELLRKKELQQQDMTEVTNAAKEMEASSKKKLEDESKGMILHSSFILKLSAIKLKTN